LTFEPILAECLQNRATNPLSAIEFIKENTKDVLQQGLKRSL